MLDKINRLLSNPNLTPKNREGLMKMKAQYKFPGGPIGKAVVGGVKKGFQNALLDKIGQAKSAGVPQKDIDTVLRNNALKARDAGVRSALLKGGLSGINRAVQNEAGLITQAGPQNQAFTPGPGGLGAAGQAFAEVGAAERGYQETLSGIEKDKLAREREDIKAEQSKEKGLKEEINSIHRIIELAASAHNLVNTAVPALTVAQSVANSKFLKGVSLAAITQGGDAGAVRDLVQTYILPAVREEVKAGTISSESEIAYTKMVADITDITTVALKAQGPGPKTDFDFIVAARATANLESSAAAIKASMKRMIDNANSALKRALQPQVNPQLDTTPPGSFDYNFASSAAGSYLESIKGELKDTITSGVEAATEAISDAKETVTDATETVLGKNELIREVAGVETVFKKVSKFDLPDDVKAEKKKLEENTGALYLSDNGYLYFVDTEGINSWYKSKEKYGVE